MNREAIADEICRAFEGLKLYSYKCPSGIWTIGWGHTPAKEHQVITSQQADALLWHDLETAHATVRLLVVAPLTENQAGALASLVFNIGASAFAKSTLLHLLNAGNYAAAQQEFHRWCRGEHIDPKTGQKEILPGLQRRRNCESLIFGGATTAQMKAANWHLEVQNHIQG